MSSRVLRKLQSDKEKELMDSEVLSDIETDTPVGGARRRQLNINRYDLLNQHSHSESEVKEDDNETEAAKSCEGNPVHESIKKKRKKRKKKSGKHVSTHRSSEDNADMDEVERSVREVNRLLGENIASSVATQSSHKQDKACKKTILSVQHKHLNPNNELKRIFGSKIIQSEHKRKNRSSSRGHVKTTWLVTCKENWPQVGKSGLSMSLIETKNSLQYFAYEHSQSYWQVETRFLQAVESLNPDNIVAIINEHPYHVNALIQLSDLCKLSEDLAMAAELIERALYCLEYAFHPLFNLAQGTCRLDYRRQENRALYITLFKHLTFLGGRACSRTSLEFCKLLLSLDPDKDPIGIKLAIDFYALRAKEYQWLVDFVTELDATHYLTQLPNFAFSLAVAYFYVGDVVRADGMLQDALLMFPGVLLPLLDACSVQVDDRVAKHAFFNGATEKSFPMSLTQLTNLYVHRGYHIWKDSDLLPWLEKNVHEVLDRVERNEPVVADYKEKRARRYAGPLPLSISRHIILSDDVKGISPFTEESGPIMRFDPLPPPDSINLYSRPQRPTTVVNTSANPLAMFLGSLLPDFNPNQIRMIEGEPDEGAGQANEDRVQNNVDLRQSVASLVDAMRDLLNIYRPDVPNDADVDENDDSADDDMT
ncbi:ribosome quality control complex subunit TCF25 [Cylas formicarius]|uniref:ribosome quality control complex subunit TCF25 n=1 Tax=Cylas formicarius TaxID=197179 RepID=UPI0029589FC2|nr:ribosome quality control complex subunit TCF25 [Cylas formicarius]XP_060534649.1 ribosome quality control complex subunit TCF25 [Cylas formicarius]